MNGVRNDQNHGGNPKRTPLDRRAGSAGSRTVCPGGHRGDGYHGIRCHRTGLRPERRGGRLQQGFLYGPGDRGQGDDGGKGAVTIMAGQGGGLSASNPDNQRWTLDTAGVAGKGQAGAGFGWTVATGDFNGDGYDDVAAGAPLMDIGTAKDAGQVLQLLGSKTG